MAQQLYKFDGYAPSRQPITVTPKLAVTSTAESGRVQTGQMQNTTMFTVESYDIEFGKVEGQDLARILRSIVGKPSFLFTYFSVYNNQWQEKQFYAANIDCSELCVKEGSTFVKSLKFQVTGIDPI